MDIHDELKDFFANEPQKVIADPIKFKNKLEIGANAYKYLSKVENIAPLLQGGALGSAVASAHFAGSAGVLGALGLASTPVGWIALSGVVGAGIIYSGNYLLKNLKRQAVVEIPKYLNTPLDLIASSVIGFIAPIALKLANTDGEISGEERIFLVRYFENEWGFDPVYVEYNIEGFIDKLEQVDFDRISGTIDELVATGDVNKSAIIKHVTDVCEQICMIEQSGHTETEQQIELLKAALENGNQSWHLLVASSAKNLKDYSDEQLVVLQRKSNEFSKSSQVLAKELSSKVTSHTENISATGTELVDKTKSLFGKYFK
ncbi:MAG: hypothetical protein P8H22_09835 [Glaciecola sp.]|nr:hypothetical protein [Glaciecola sp.]